MKLQYHQASTQSTLEGLATTEIKLKYLNFREDLTKEESTAIKKGRQTKRLMRQLRDQLRSQRIMVQQIDIYGAPTDYHQENYFNMKMKNYSEAMKMENSVNNFEIDRILKNGKNYISGLSKYGKKTK
jgi:hypothetical protein